MKSRDMTKPLGLLRKFAKHLGWRSRLQLYQHHIDEREAAWKGLERVVTWYEAAGSTDGKSDFFLQFNETPQGQTVTYSGAVYAIRYRIFTGWHDFQLFASDYDLKREAERLVEWLAYDMFSTIETRRVFRKAHPECAGYTWRRIVRE
jgi:hypothetical protein